MKIKTGYEEIWQEYMDGVNYNASSEINLVETVKRNENFYVGRQWEGLEVPDLDKPVLNLLRRVVTFFISSIVSDDIAVGLNAFSSAGLSKAVLDMLSGQFGEVMELCGFKAKSRDAMRNAAVDGDGCLHYYFDMDEDVQVDTEDAFIKGFADFESMPDEPVQSTGRIEAEVLDNTCVFFGNPQEVAVARQPWIIIQLRRFVDEVKAQAKAHGGDPDGVSADSDENGIHRDTEKDKVTVLRKYYREGGVVHYTEVTAGAVVRPPVKLGYRRYPLVWLPWEKVKNSYHGMAAITGMIPNQIFINKMMAMVMEHLKNTAFPKTIYSKTMIPEGWTNRVGAAIGVIGDPNQAVATGYRPPDMSSQVLGTIDAMINYTRDTMGASDAALGNIKPDNTSAIIATQKATSMPLELQKMEFYQFVEDSVRIWLEMMGQNYGPRLVEMNLPEPELAPDGMTMTAPELPNGVVKVVSAGDSEDSASLVLFDFSVLRGMNLRLNVDIGASTYWSELMQVQTLDNLFERKVIDDPEVYLENIPAAYLPNKNQLLEAVRQRKAEAEAAMQAQVAAPQQETEPALPTELAGVMAGGGVV